MTRFAVNVLNRLAHTWPGMSRTASSMAATCATVNQGSSDVIRKLIASSLLHKFFFPANQTLISPSVFWVSDFGMAFALMFTHFHSEFLHLCSRPRSVELLIEIEIVSKSRASKSFLSNVSFASFLMSSVCIGPFCLLKSFKVAGKHEYAKWRGRSVRWAQRNSTPGVLCAWALVRMNVLCIRSDALRRSPKQNCFRFHCACYNNSVVSIVGLLLFVSFSLSPGSQRTTFTRKQYNCRTFTLGLIRRRLWTAHTCTHECVELQFVYSNLVLGSRTNRNTMWSTVYCCRSSVDLCCHYRICFFFSMSVWTMAATTTTARAQKGKSDVNETEKERHTTAGEKNSTEKLFDQYDLMFVRVWMRSIPHPRSRSNCLARAHHYKLKSKCFTRIPLFGISCCFVEFARENTQFGISVFDRQSIPFMRKLSVAISHRLIAVQKIRVGINESVSTCVKIYFPFCYFRASDSDSMISALE